MDTLPPELIHSIALTSHLSPSDVSSLSLTSSSLASILTYDPYARDLRSALFGVLPNVLLKRFRAANFALSRRWWGQAEHIPTTLWRDVLVAGWDKKVVLESEEDVEAMDRMLLAALSLDEAEGWEKGMERKQKGCAFLAKLPLLVGASFLGATRVVQWGVERGLDVNGVAWPRKLTPIFMAAQNQHVEIVDFLLQNGANGDAAISYDLTPLYAASENGNVDIVRLLLGHGVDGEKCSSYGCTPLSIASQRNKPEVVRLLLEYGVDVDKPNVNDCTPLNAVDMVCGVDVVRLLVEEGGADVERGDNSGGFPLLKATWSPSPEPASLLLRAGADVNRQNNQGVTPLFNASKINHPEVVRLLLQAGADPSIPTHKGETPLSIATANDHTDIIALLSDHHHHVSDS